MGVAIPFTHSQSDAFGRVIVNARLKLVRAVVAAQLTGPPLANAIFASACAILRADRNVARRRPRDHPSVATEPDA